MIFGKCRKGPSSHLPITTVAAVLRVYRYISDQNHKNHLGKVKVSIPEFWYGDNGQFSHLIETGDDFAKWCFEHKKSYLSGKKPKPDFPAIYHLYFSPPPESHLNEFEKKSLVCSVLRKLAPCVPAVYNWHLGKTRDDCHIMLPTTTTDRQNLITYLRKLYMINGFRGLLNFAAKSALDVVNKQRTKEHKIRTLEERKTSQSIKRNFMYFLSNPDNADLSFFLDRIEIIKYLKSHGCVITKVTKKNLSGFHPDFEKTYSRLAWDDIHLMYDEIRWRRERCLQEFKDTEKTTAIDHSPDMDRNPEIELL